MRSTVFILLCLVVAVYCHSWRQRKCGDLLSSKRCSRYRSYCNVKESGWKRWMKRNCRRTCGFCNIKSCRDLISGKECSSYRNYCNVQAGGWKWWMKRNCPRTCGFCGNSIAPEMTKAPKGQVAKMGETVVFSCEFKGVPEPTVTWTKGGVEIKNDSRFLVVVQKGYTAVQITKVTKSDNGNYMVALRNAAGSASAWAQLIVTGVPSPPPPPPPPPPAPPTSNPPTCGVKGRGHTRIVGGEIAAPGDWPWQVTYDFVGNTNNLGHWCGASIISPHWILTAAHCFTMGDKPEEYTLTVGDFDISQEEGHEQEMKIEKIILHENYNSETFDYDIALVKLNNPVRFSTRVRPVCLPDEGMDFATGTNCYVTGWGKLQEMGKFPKRLYQAKVPLVGRQNCSATYALHHGFTITERMRCAGFVNGGIDACQGDSGGPLVCNRGSRWYLMGAVSWGVGCARSNAYGVYTDISKLKPWVVNAMNIN